MKIDKNKSLIAQVKKFSRNRGFHDNCQFCKNNENCVFIGIENFVNTNCIRNSVKIENNCEN